MRRVVFVLGAALALASCRDAPEPFDADNFGERADTGSIRLTWSSGSDVAPAFVPRPIR
jgi:hypothetical protein